MRSSDTSAVRTGVFRKSSYSQSEADCVEVTDLHSSTAIRDTKHRELGALFFGADEWQAFVNSAKDT
ncbi:DUF397 domain-containing protein [Nocardiopsis algeriensis]|uniref:DUF397 domain-containing protein n=1 Tax=Nocardiopsis algeriensis TaxID=1478215 RepID=A0A841IS95_9ACTN|nr:hypothetical protein [Nocardiopsis algeriensis]